MELSKNFICKQLTELIFGEHRVVYNDVQFYFLVAVVTGGRARNEIVPNIRREVLKVRLLFFFCDLNLNKSIKKIGQVCKVRFFKYAIKV